MKNWISGLTLCQWFSQSNGNDNDVHSQDSFSVPLMLIISFNPQDTFQSVSLVFNFSDKRYYMNFQDHVVRKCLSWNSNSHLWIPALVSLHKISESKIHFFHWKCILCSLGRMAVIFYCLFHNSLWGNLYQRRNSIEIHEDPGIVSYNKRNVHRFVHIREKS